MYSIHNTAHVRHRSKTKTKRNDIELSFLQYSIRLDKLIILVWSDVKIGCQNRMSNQNDQLVEQFEKAKLYLIPFTLSCQFFDPVLLRGLTWSVLRAWAQNHSKWWVHVHAITRNPQLKILFSKVKCLDPPLNSTLVREFASVTFFVIIHAAIFACFTIQGNILSYYISILSQHGKSWIKPE